MQRRHTFGLLLGWLAAGYVMAAPPTPAQVTVPAPESPSAEPAAIDQAAQAAGMAVLRSAVEAFGAAPVVRCATHVQIKPPTGGVRTIDVVSVFGPDGFAWIRAPESVVSVEGGIMRIVLQSVYDRYLEVPVGDSMVDGIGAIMGDESLAGFEAMMREGRPPEDWLEAALMRTIGRPVVTGLETTVSDDGVTQARVLLHGTYGTGWIDVRQDTHQMTGSHAHLVVVPDENLEPFELQMDLTTKVEFLEAVPEGLTFDPGIRTPVSTRQDLDPVLRNRLKIGQKAPPLAAVSPSGERWQLREHAGTPVVLCFWTSWAKASRQGVDQLESLYRTLQREEGLPDAVCVAVNVLEEEPELAPRQQAAGGMWEQAQLTVPLLVAPDETIQTQWAVTGIPYLVLIGPDGAVLDAAVGVSEGWLKRTLRTLETLQGQSDPGT